ncbi:hypothetical protein AAFF_G00098560 [Aldrovandia affinis]|uniref:Uncharacterized protein n=1 Tax=Aldrovandia affinis TaxID=143900 RepID=A0AAD7RXS4_9TELE|nr:hypothetical protein AAFF_G00098560 [Aldrovandia affinis]
MGRPGPHLSLASGGRHSSPLGPASTPPPPGTTAPHPSALAPYLVSTILSPVARSRERTTERPGSVCLGCSGFVCRPRTEPPLACPPPGWGSSIRAAPCPAWGAVEEGAYPSQYTAVLNTTGLRPHSSYTPTNPPQPRHHTLAQERARKLCPTDISTCKPSGVNPSSITMASPGWSGVRTAAGMLGVTVATMGGWGLGSELLPSGIWDKRGSSGVKTAVNLPELGGDEGGPHSAPCQHPCPPPPPSSIRSALDKDPRPSSRRGVLPSDKRGLLVSKRETRGREEESSGAHPALI